MFVGVLKLSENIWAYRGPKRRIVEKLLVACFNANNDEYLHVEPETVDNAEDFDHIHDLLLFFDDLDGKAEICHNIEVYIFADFPGQNRMELLN